jgi:ParB family chromosome partitioning protein
MLGLGLIRPNPKQPRQRFSEEAIRSLADSIQTAGLMQPIVVRPSAKGFELVAGERRWRAFGLLGKTEIPSIVRTIDDQTAAEWALIENLQREDLDVLERADGIARLMEEFGLSQSAVAIQIGLDRTTVTNLLRLRDADPNLRAALVEGLVTQGHAKALLGTIDLVQRSKLLERCVREGWSVRETERRVREVPSSDKDDQVAVDQSPGGGKTPHIADLEKRLAQHLGTKVAISLGRKKGRGRLSLEFFSIEQFDGLLEKIGFDTNSE